MPIWIRACAWGDKIPGKGGPAGDDGAGAIHGIQKKVVGSLAPRIRELRRSLRFLRQNPLAVIGLVMIMTIVAIALLAPVLAPPLPTQTDPMINRMDLAPPKPPGSNGVITGYPVQFPMGTGQSGEDIYYGVIWGARTSMYVAILIISISALVGIVVGGIAGYYGGIFDEILMRVTDVFFSIPGLILALGVVAVLGKSLDNIILALVIAWWPAYARLVRGQVMMIRESTYVEAARAIGAKDGRILFRHVIPNSLSPMTVCITMDMGAVVLVAAGLSFIGFSQPGLCEWGRMVSGGSTLMFSKYPYPFPDGPLYNPWWAWVIPSVFILVFVMGFNLFGDALRDMMDPRLRK